MSDGPDAREQALDAAAREYGRLLAFGDRRSRVQMERKHGDLMPELSARLDDVERLLGSPTRPHTTESALSQLQREQTLGYEWRSEAELCGWPLVHIANGIDPATGKRRVAKGVIAIGNVAVGGVAIGGMTVGIVSFGGLSLGVVALGGCAAGGAALGGLALGLFAVGGMAIGLIAMGGFAVGHFAAGGGGIGTHVLSGGIRDPEAQAVFGPILDAVRSLIGR